MKKKGFTLIELLVVIAIIAILASILFPVFARARENARRSSCASNAKQLMLGVMQYTQDFDEKFPFALTSGALAAGESKYTWNQLVSPYVKSTQVFRCPSSAKTDVVSGFGSLNGEPQFHSDYLGNVQVLGDPANAYGYGKTISLGKIQQTATTVFLIDGGAKYSASDPTGASWLPWGTAVFTNSPESPFGGYMDGSFGQWGAPMPRHLETLNVGFCDGHVKAMKLDKIYTANSAWFNPTVGGS